MEVPATLLLSLLLVLYPAPLEAQYEPTWDSLDSRPLPAWYDEAKVGIFIHWGVFSVPSFSQGRASEWFWEGWRGDKRKAYIDFMAANYRPGFTYADFGNQFTAEFFNPHQWINLFKDAGAKYFVFTSKHHDGYTNWPSAYSFNWNSWTIGPRKDIVGMLANATKDIGGIRFGLYHSLYEWFNPLYMLDKSNKFETQYFVNQKTMPELYEIVNKYEPEVIFSDGEWDANSTYWNSTHFLAWLYNSSPVKDTIAVNDRWGKDTTCKHGGYLTCGDRFNPGKLQKRKFENAMTIDKYSWGFARTSNLNDYLTIENIIETLIKTVSCGGNLLINVGPSHDGRITPIYEERLRQLGKWLKVNGDAVYATRPWTHQNDTVTERVWYTSKKTDAGTAMYATLLNWPTTSTLILGAPVPTSQTTVTLEGYTGAPFTWRRHPGGGIEIDIPVISIVHMPCDWAWVLKITGLAEVERNFHMPERYMRVVDHSNDHHNNIF